MSLSSGDMSPDNDQSYIVRNVEFPLVLFSTTPTTDKLHCATTNLLHTKKEIPVMVVGGKGPSNSPQLGRDWKSTYRTRQELNPAHQRPMINSPINGMPFPSLHRYPNRGHRGCTIRRWKFPKGKRTKCSDKSKNLHKCKWQNLHPGLCKGTSVDKVCHLM